MTSNPTCSLSRAAALLLPLWPLLAAPPSGCRQEPPATDSGSYVVAPVAAPTTPASATRTAYAQPSIRLRVYPDMAVPGKTVVVEAELLHAPVGEVPELTYATDNEYCQGDAQQEGNRLTYHVPASCRGTSLVLEAVATGSFGEVREGITLDIKRSSALDAVVFSHPVPGQTLTAPVALTWDRTLYSNRGEQLNFQVKRLDQVILEANQVNHDELLELDLPPSPEPTILIGQTTSGTRESALLRIHSRKVPAWSGDVLMIDSFALPDLNSMERPRELLDEGGKVITGIGLRLAAEGRTSFLHLTYHVAKARRHGLSDGRLGIRQIVPVRATVDEYKDLKVWLRRQPGGEAVGPVKVQLAGSKGSARTFTIKRLKENWHEYYFPLAGALRRGSDERLTSVELFVAAKDVSPPLGVICFGALYLEPHGGRREAERVGTAPSAEEESVD